MKKLTLFIVLNSNKYCILVLSLCCLKKIPLDFICGYIVNEVANEE